MTDRFESRWTRIAAEGAAIVASILLAFAIDAWWDGRVEHAEAIELVASLRDDFSASQAHVEQWLAGNRRILDSLETLLDVIEGGEVGEDVEVPLAVIVGSIGAPTYSPTDATVSAAISSGKIELIRDHELRTALALWLQQIADTREDELLIREITVAQLIPQLAAQVRLARAFDFETLTTMFLDPQSPGLAGTAPLRVTTSLEGAVAERLFYTHFVVGGLQEIRDTQADIIRLLDAQFVDR